MNRLTDPLKFVSPPFPILAKPLPPSVKTLIGICGPARSGKDTTAQILNSLYDFKRFAFADRVKKAVEGAFGIPTYNQNSDNLKELPDHYWGTSPRKLAQLVGTECFREVFGPEIWIAALVRDLYYDPRKYVCISDVRFQSESDWIIANNGYLLCLTRPGADGKVGIASHASEAGIDFTNYPQERVYDVINNDSIKSLRNTISDVMNSILSSK